MSREFDELLSAYLDGEVSPEERAAVERRLEQSPALRETLDELSEVGDLIRSLPLARAPVDLPERVVAAIAPASLSSTSQAQKKRRLFGTWPLMAAGSVLAAGVAIVVLLPRQPANLADGLAFTEKRFGTEAATARESLDRARGLAKAEAGASRMSSAVEPAGTTLNFDDSGIKESLTETVRKLERPLRPGEVIDTLQNNAGRTQVVRYVVVDTRRIGTTMNTILTNNSFNIVETETSVPRGEATVAPATNDRYVYYLEGPPQQVEKTLEQIEQLPEFRDWDDLGVLASDSDPTPVEPFADIPSEPVNEFGLNDLKDKADRPTAAPAAPAAPPRFAAQQSQADFPTPAPTPASSAVTADANRAKGALFADPTESKAAAESTRRLAPAPAQESTLRAEVERLSTAAPPQATNTYLGVSARVESNAPIVENVLKSRAAGNSLQRNGMQGNSTQGMSPQRQAVGQTQSNFFRARNMRLSEYQFGRGNEPQVGEQQKQLEEAKAAVQLKQQVGDKAVADTTTDLQAATVANPGNVPSQEDGFVRALIILEPQPPQPAAPAADQAPRKAGD